MKRKKQDSIFSGFVPPVVITGFIMYAGMMVSQF
jgi:hypothetical protein